MRDKGLKKEEHQLDFINNKLSNNMTDLDIKNYNLPLIKKTEVLSSPPKEMLKHPAVARAAGFFGVF